jgi:hypothetical protein
LLKYGEIETHKKMISIFLLNVVKYPEIINFFNIRMPKT